MTVARNHHYVPRCYLKGFASGGGRTPHTTVVDVVDKRSFRTSIKNVCSLRDFNRVDLPGQPIDILEKQLAKFDSELGSALKTIETTRSLEDEHARLLLLNFASVVAARNPAFRSRREDAVRHTWRVIADMVASDRELYESQVAAAKRSGDMPADLNLPFERFRASVQKDQFVLSFPPGYHHLTEFEAQDEVLKSILARNWALLRAPTRAEFITSDLPACLWPNFTTRRPVGFATQDTTVVLPVTSTLLALGEFDGREGAFDVPREYVAKLNLAIALRCDRQIYAKSPNFETADVDGQVTIGPELIHRIIASLRPPRGGKRPRARSAGEDGSSSGD